VFGPGNWWIGYRMNRSGSEVQILQIDPKALICANAEL
jgi:hypothetical protein